MYEARDIESRYFVEIENRTLDHSGGVINGVSLLYLADRGDENPVGVQVGSISSARGARILFCQRRKRKLHSQLRSFGTRLSLRPRNVLFPRDLFS